MHASLASRIAVVLCCLAALNLLPGARGQDKEVEKLAEQLKKLNVELKLDNSNPAEPWYTIEVKKSKFSERTRKLEAAEFAKLVPILQETTVPIGLVLHHSSFTDSDLASLEKLGCLRSLTLDFDTLTDKGLRHLAGIKDLSDLTIVCESLKGVPPKEKPRKDITKAGMDSLQSLKKLESLSLSRCAHLVKGDALAVLTVLPKLRKLSIDPGRDLAGQGFMPKKKAKGVRVIDLEASRLIGSIANLQTLALRGDIGADVLEAIKNMHSLVELDLFYSSTKDADLVHLSDLKSLRILNLGLTRVTNDGLRHLGGLKNLETLVLGSGISDEGLAHLAGLTKLKVLDMGNCAVRGEGLKHLVAWQQLEKLNLARNPLTEDGLLHLRPLSDLRELDLSGTQFDEDTVWALKKALPRAKITDPLGDEVPLVKQNARKPEDLRKAAADFKLTATEYFKEFVSGRDAARDKYKNKVVELSGEVVRCGIDKDPFIALERFPAGLPGSYSYGARCITAEDQPWARHAPGQKATIRGRQADEARPILLDSIVVEAEPSTAVVLTVEELSRELAADTKATHKKYAGKTLLLSGILAERELKTGDPLLGGGDVRLRLKTEGNIRIIATVNKPQAATTRRFKAGDAITLYGQFSSGGFVANNQALLSSCLPIKKDAK